jgi:hypothetical protein
LALKIENNMNENLSALKLRYRKLSDEDIERLANYEAGGLTPDAFQILKMEIERRGLPKELSIAADIQAKGLSEGDHLELMRKLAMFPCPLCNKKQVALNAFNTMIVKSILVFTKTEVSLIIGCPVCISAIAKSSLIKSLLLGWWGIPFGPIKVIHSVFVNLRAMNAGAKIGPTKEFKEFIEPKAAAIKARIRDSNDLNRLLSNI